ncbi:hypothetical protein ANO14919_054170 [Xylariales sp. No.14919]|nr:hypothetical protein ANO14919_054170 [Xylariales sp. No.14919]
MATKRAVILALGGTAFAQMSGDMSGSSVPNSIASGDESSNVIVPTTSSSLVGITDPPAITTDTAATSSNASDTTGSSTSAENSSAETITPIVHSSTAASSLHVTGTTDRSTVTETAPVTTTRMEGMGTGASMPNTNPSRSVTGRPVSGNAVVNGVSIGIFVVSVALTALLQM